ncbi:MAG: valine--tRNA ligase, partial [Gammaproteobacteria bacterium]|nr:valine--tRNA ligase [Gammaproteobacteria bacterium]
SNSDQQSIENNRDLLVALAKLQSIDCLKQDEQAPESATSLVGDMRLLIPLAGLIDKDAELQRLQKKMQKHEQDIQRLEGKLNNEKFVANAPFDVVNREKEKLVDAQSALASLQEQAVRISAI